MSWTEGSVTFTATIRRSGNSLVVTIPVELVKRFLIQEGQRVMLVDMTRKVYGVEGMIGIYLGLFKVIEKAPVVRLKIKNYKVLTEDIEKGIPVAEEIARKYEATAIRYETEDEAVDVEIQFGRIKENFIMPRTDEEIKGIAEELRREIEEMGGEVLEIKIEKREVTHTMVDPSVVSKSIHLNKETIKWKWEI